MLNVYKPDSCCWSMSSGSGDGCPVIIWLHDGSFQVSLIDKLISQPSVCGPLSDHYFSFLQDIRWRAFQLWPKINHGLQRNFRLYQLPTGSDGISQVHFFRNFNTYFLLFFCMRLFDGFFVRQKFEYKNSKFEYI